MAMAKLTRENDVETDNYSQRVKQNQAPPSLNSIPDVDVRMPMSPEMAATRPRNIPNPHTRPNGANGREFPAQDMPDRFRADPDLGGDVPPPSKPAVPRRQEPKPFKPSKIDKNVRHGVEVDGGMHDFMDKLPAVPGVLNALAQLDADGDLVKKEEISKAIDEVLQFTEDADDLGPIQPATPEIIRQADISTQAALPDYDFTDDDGDDGDGSEDSALEFLGALVAVDGE